jgi:hypothetical protein
MLVNASMDETAMVAERKHTAKIWLRLDPRNRMMRDAPSSENNNQPSGPIKNTARVAKGTKQPAINSASLEVT